MSEQETRSRFNWSHRLYVRIYLAMLISLIVAGLLFAAAWRMNADSRQIGPSLESFAAIASDVLPPPEASNEEQQQALTRWQSRMRADLTLYSAKRVKIASAGRELPPLDTKQVSSGWLGGEPPVFAVKLPDDRWLVGQHRGRRKPPVSFFTALVLIGLAMGIGSYPIVRRLTRRMERLQTSVELLGVGCWSVINTHRGRRSG